MSDYSSISAQLRELLPQLFTEKQIKGDRYLRFQINSEMTTLISIDDVRESLLMGRDKITPIPKMPPFVMGVINSRERVFLVIDLPLLLNLSPISNYAREYNVIVINASRFLPKNKTSELWLGLAVDKIQGITRTEQQPIEDYPRSPSPSVENTMLGKYIKGWVLVQNQPLAILDLAKIVQESF